MYIPKQFLLEDRQEIMQYIREHSFATLVSLKDGLPIATHIPLEVEEGGEGSFSLVGHIAKANEQWKYFKDNNHVLSIFSAHSSYISPSWYDHENVPTWNYIAVHVTGTATTIDGKDMLPYLAQQTDKYEAGVKGHLQVSALSKELLDSHLSGIVGIKITVTNIEAVNKLSQNRDKKNFDNIISELEKSGVPDALKIAGAMRKTTMHIINSIPEDIDTIFNLYDVAVSLQKVIGTVHWPEFEKGMIATEIKERRQWKMIIDGEVACIWATTFNDPQIWEERNADPAIYIHRIATAPAFRGKDLVSEIVTWAKKYAKENNRNFIRLDTVGKNEKLIAHYCKCGFKYLGMVKLMDTEGLPDHYSLDDVCLFEIAL